MKKITALLTALLLVFAAIGANAQSFDFLSQVYPDYTGNYTFSLTFDNADSVASLLKELNMPDEINNFIDVKAMLEGLLSVDGTLVTEMSFSKDFKKGEIALTSDSVHGITVNKNLELNAKCKLGMWMSVDMTDITAPKCTVIYSYPFTNKYMHIDLFDMLTEQSDKDAMAGFFASVFNEQFMNDISTFSAGLVAKYADIKMSGSTATVKIDAAAFSSILSELAPKINELYKPLMTAYGDGSDEYNAVAESMDMMKKLAELTFVGKDGITLTYRLSGGKITACSANLDMQIDIKQIYKLLTGEDWQLANNGTLDFTFKYNASLSKYGTTKVNIPVLTADNSFSLNDMINDLTPGGQYDPSENYVWIPVETTALPVIDGTFYIPVRDFANAACEDAEITFNNGEIRITNKEGSDAPFSEMVLNAGSDKVTINGTEYTANGNTFIDNSMTFVSSSVFKDAFGWQIAYADFDMLTGTYSFCFDSAD